MAVKYCPLCEWPHIELEEFMLHLHEGACERNQKMRLEATLEGDQR